jgi:hypothetical protein
VEITVMTVCESFGFNLPATSLVVTYIAYIIRYKDVLFSNTLSVGTETGLDGLHGVRRSASLAHFKQQSIFLLQLSLRAPACSADDVLGDIFSEHVFELFGLETTLNNQLVITTNGTSGTQLGQDESQDVIGFTIDTLAVVHEVDPSNSLGTDTTHLRRFNRLSVAAHAETLSLALLSGNSVVESCQEL